MYGNLSCRTAKSVLLGLYLTALLASASSLSKTQSIPARKQRQERPSEEHIAFRNNLYVQVQLHAPREAQVLKPNLTPISVESMVGVVA